MTSSGPVGGVTLGTDIEAAATIVDIEQLPELNIPIRSHVGTLASGAATPVPVLNRYGLLLLMLLLGLVIHFKIRRQVLM